MLLQVHDELIFESPAEQADAVCALARRVMGAAALPAVALSVPLVVDARAAANWDEAHSKMDSPPPCGAGLGVGVSARGPPAIANRLDDEHPARTPTPDPSPQGGGEHARQVRPLVNKPQTDPFHSIKQRDMIRLASLDAPCAPL